MKSCNSFKDMEQFGIRPLTGEADALGYRILCDLTEQGCKVFKECYGIPLVGPLGHVMQSGLADNWNSGAVASVMLTGHDIVPLAIMGFYLKGYTVVLTYDKNDHETVFALEADEDLQWDEEANTYMFKSGDCEGHPWPESVYGKVFRFITQPKGDQVRGDRNIHQMSGRSL